MLSEQQILDRWQRLFRDKVHYEDDLCSAEKLLGELADYSPVRQRLNDELIEIQSRHQSALAQDEPQ